MSSTARSLILSRPVVVVSLFVAFALVIAAVALSSLSTREVTAAGTRVVQAQRALVTINQVLATVNEAETAQRGYILTHDEKYLAPYDAARPRYQQEIAALREQLRGDANAAAEIDRLDALCVARFADIARTIKLRREHGIAPALNVVESDAGWRIMNEIRSRLRVLQGQQLAEIAGDSAGAAETMRVFRVLDGTLLAVATILAGTAAVLVIRRLHDLEGLIKVCAWTHRVQWQGEWISFEEYLAKRFNLNCTHGISDEAAKRLGDEIANTPLAGDV